MTRSCLRNKPRSELVSNCFLFCFFDFVFDTTVAIGKKTPKKIYFYGIAGRRARTDTRLWKIVSHAWRARRQMKMDVSSMYRLYIYFFCLFFFLVFSRWVHCVLREPLPQRGVKTVVGGVQHLAPTFFFVTVKLQKSRGVQAGTRLQGYSIYGHKH